MNNTILVVDDEKDIVELLTYNLNKEGFTVLNAYNGKAALEKAKQKPDIIILDLMMPEMSGFQVIQELKKDKSTSIIPILVLTSKGTETDEIVGLEVGADDYIVKPVKIGKIVARIHAMLRRQEHFTQRAIPQMDIIKIKDMEINVSSYTASIGKKKIVLPRKEFETLVYLIRNKGRVLPRESILNAVWGENVNVVDRTIDVHIRKIREKLGDYADYIETVSGVGYRFKS